MSLRLVEIFHQKGEPEDLKFLLEDIPVYEFWADKLPDGRMNVRLLLRARDVDKVVDVFESFFQDKERYRIVVLPVDAAVPREEEDKAEKESTEEPAPSEAQEATEGISVEELYQKISPSAKLSRRFVSLVVISSIVAAIGLLKDDVAVIIGSMVIAPLLGPFVGLSLASVLGDFELMKNSLPTVLTGAAIAVSIGLLAGYFCPLRHGLFPRSPFPLPGGLSLHTPCHHIWYCRRLFPHTGHARDPCGRNDGSLCTSAPGGRWHHAFQTYARAGIGRLYCFPH